MGDVMPARGPWDCPECGQVHPRGCHAHRLLKDDAGELLLDGEGNVQRAPCRKSALIGLTVCTAHGGRNPAAKAKSQRAKDDMAAARQLARLGRKIEIHPADALVDLVHWTAGEVAYWREKVTELEAEGGHEALTWGRTMEVDKRSGEFPGIDTTEEAKPAAAYAMLTDASNRLATYAAAALRAGVDERRVAIAERQGQLLAAAVRAILEALHLTPEQWALVPQVVPTQLRLLSGRPVEAGE